MTHALYDESMSRFIVYLALESIFSCSFTTIDILVLRVRNAIEIFIAEAMTSCYVNETIAS